MTANPYESPETVQSPQPAKTNLLNVLYWFVAAVGAVVLFVFLFVLPNVRSSPEAARRMQCSNHLKQIGVALQNYHDAYGALPPAFIADADGKPTHSWRVLILPYLGEKAFYDKYDLSEPWNGPNNSKLHGELVHVFLCPSRPGKQPHTDTSYVAVTGPGTAWPSDKAVTLKNITDGTSNAILVVEMAHSGIHWMEPRDVELDQIPMDVNPKGAQGISSPHPNVALTLFADGHTAALTNNTPAEIIRRLLTISDGEWIGDY